MTIEQFGTLWNPVEPFSKLILKMPLELCALAR